MRKAYLAMIKAFPGGWDAMAAALGYTRMALENRIYERRGQSMSADTALMMQKLSNTTFYAEEVANQSDGIFIPIPEFTGVSDMALLDAYTEMVSDEGKFATDFREALKDGKVTQAEFEKLRKDLRQQQAHEMELLARIESLIVKI
ncbi:hypothetical protein GALL_71610 [mine drainage metagenome]|uniref:Uncharacterized protein n=1 Tax=mine drainage metagenome TaxID=410659 RepID=A0A1J5TG44_9ZZZZ